MEVVHSNVIGHQRVIFVSPVFVPTSQVDVNPSLDAHLVSHRCPAFSAIDSSSTYSLHGYSDNVVSSRQSRPQGRSDPQQPALQQGECVHT